MFLEASPSCTCKTIYCKQIFITKAIYCKKYIDEEKKTIAKNIHCKTIFIAKKYSLPEEFLGKKSIFLATCVNRGFPIICTCKNTEPTHRIAL